MMVSLAGRAIAALAVLVGAIGVLGVSEAGSASATSQSLGGGRAVVDAMATSSYGTVLVTSFGPYADIPLFELSSDTKTSSLCTHAVVTTFEGPITCTGPESDFS